MPQRSELSMRHLPDISEASFSFQLPRLAQEDNLLAQTDDSFFQGAEFTLAPSVAPTPRRPQDTNRPPSPSSSNNPSTLGQPTPRRSKRMKTPSLSSKAPFPPTLSHEFVPATTPTTSTDDRSDAQTSAPEDSHTTVPKPRSRAATRVTRAATSSQDRLIKRRVTSTTRPSATQTPTIGMSHIIDNANPPFQTGSDTPSLGRPLAGQGSSVSGGSSKVEAAEGSPSVGRLDAQALRAARGRVASSASTTTSTHDHTSVKLPNSDVNEGGDSTGLQGSTGTGRSRTKGALDHGNSIMGGSGRSRGTTMIVIGHEEREAEGRREAVEGDDKSKGRRRATRTKGITSDLGEASRDRCPEARDPPGELPSELNQQHEQVGIRNLRDAAMLIPVMEEEGVIDPVQPEAQEITRPSRRRIVLKNPFLAASSASPTIPHRNSNPDAYMPMPMEVDQLPQLAEAAARPESDETESEQPSRHRRSPSPQPASPYPHSNRHSRPPVDRGSTGTDPNALPGRFGAASSSPISSEPLPPLPPPPLLPPCPATQSARVPVTTTTTTSGNPTPRHDDEVRPLTPPVPANIPRPTTLVRDSKRERQEELLLSDSNPNDNQINSLRQQEGRSSSKRPAFSTRSQSESKGVGTRRARVGGDDDRDEDDGEGRVRKKVKVSEDARDVNTKSRSRTISTTKAKPTTIPTTRPRKPTVNRPKPLPNARQQPQTLPLNPGPDPQDVNEDGDKMLLSSTGAGSSTITSDIKRSCSDIPGPASSVQGGSQNVLLLNDNMGAGKKDLGKRELSLGSMGGGTTRSRGGAGGDTGGVGGDSAQSGNEALRNVQRAASTSASTTASTTSARARNNSSLNARGRRVVSASAAVSKNVKTAISRTRVASATIQIQRGGRTRKEEKGDIIDEEAPTPPQDLDDEDEDKDGPQPMVIDEKGNLDAAEQTSREPVFKHIPSPLLTDRGVVGVGVAGIAPMGDEGLVGSIGLVAAAAQTLLDDGADSDEMVMVDPHRHGVQEEGHGRGLASGCGDHGGSDVREGSTGTPGAMDVVQEGGGNDLTHRAGDRVESQEQDAGVGLGLEGSKTGVKGTRRIRLTRQGNVEGRVGIDVQEPANSVSLSKANEREGRDGDEEREGDHIAVDAARQRRVQVVSGTSEAIDRRAPLNATYPAAAVRAATRTGRSTTTKGLASTATQSLALGDDDANVPPAATTSEATTTRLLAGSSGSRSVSRLGRSKSAAGVGADEESERPRRQKVYRTVHPIPDFKALHAQHEAELALRKENVRPTIPLPVYFETDIRAKERETFEAGVREREAEAARLAEEARLAALAEEERAVREMRKKAVPKANVVPSWYAKMPKRKDK